VLKICFFWVAVREFKALVAPRMDDVEFIVSTYILVSAPYQVNISDTIRSRTLQNVARWPLPLDEDRASICIFEEAQNEVYNLMNRDAYPRFVARNKAKRRDSKANILLDPA